MSSSGISSPTFWNKWPHLFSTQRISGPTFWNTANEWPHLLDALVEKVGLPFIECVSLTAVPQSRTNRPSNPFWPRSTGRRKRWANRPGVFFSKSQVCGEVCDRFRSASRDGYAVVGKICAGLCPRADRHRRITARLAKSRQAYGGCAVPTCANVEKKKGGELDAHRPEVRLVRAPLTTQPSVTPRRPPCRLKPLRYLQGHASLRCRSASCRASCCLGVLPGCLIP